MAVQHGVEDAKGDSTGLSKSVEVGLVVEMLPNNEQYLVGEIA